MEVKDRILTESGMLFAKYGIKSMTMDSLAEELGISKRTIYECFKDKDTLLMEVILYYKDKSHAEASNLIKQSDNAIEALFRIMKMSIDQMMRMSPAFFHDMKKYHGKVFKALAEPGDIRDFSITRQLIETGMTQGVFRNDINLDIVNQTLHTLFDLFGPDSKLIEAGFNRKDMFEHIIIPFFRGLSTRKGQKLLEDCKIILE